MPVLTLTPIEGLSDEERAVMAEALAAFEDARDFGAGLETKDSATGRARRRQLFREATVAHRLIERISAAAT